MAHFPSPTPSASAVPTGPGPHCPRTLCLLVLLAKSQSDHVPTTSLITCRCISTRLGGAPPLPVWSPPCRICPVVWSTSSLQVFHLLCSESPILPAPSQAALPAECSPSLCPPLFVVLHHCFIQVSVFPRLSVPWGQGPPWRRCHWVPGTWLCASHMSAH